MSFVFFEEGKEAFLMVEEFDICVFKDGFVVFHVINGFANDVEFDNVFFESGKDVFTEFGHDRIEEGDVALDEVPKSVIIEHPSAILFGDIFHHFSNIFK